MAPKELDTRRPFTRADAVEAGIAPKLLRGSGFRRIFRGVYVKASVKDSPLLRAEAALVPHPATAFASHASSARVHGVPVPALPDEHVTVLSAADRRDRAGVRAHVSDDGDVIEVRGVRLSGYLRMFVELGELLTLVDLVVVGDNLVRRRLVTPAELVAFCSTSRLRGAAAARRAAGYVRQRVDSPMETRLRMLLVLAGLPEPRTNVEFRNEVGDVVRKHDLLYPASKTAVEYDGRAHVKREHQWERDLRRREDSESDGYRLVVIVAADVYQHPGETVLRLWRILQERGEPGLPRVLSDAWRPHFPGRDAA